MTGKLKIEMIYDSSTILGAEFWGKLRLTYYENTQEKTLYYTTTALDRFVRWYLSASPFIFEEPPIPFVEGKN